MNFSIIIPCFNEGENVVALTQRIQKTLENTSYSNDYEIWFIDDSRDHTPALLKQLSSQYKNVHYQHRTTARGLGSAVVTGFSLSSGQYLIVMDADLQHPPEVLTAVMNALNNHDVVIPSRFIPGGSDGGLNALRKCVSLVARKIGQCALKRFRNITDCTSGFFGLHRDVIQNTTLNPGSWKILMEILVKGRYQTITEIPYQFMARDLGDSKMNMREQLRYLMHIAKLIAISPDDRRFYLFCIVGLLGVFVNLIFFHVFVQCHFHVLAASVLASSIALLHNFLWHHHVTWKDCRPTRLAKKIIQFPQFILISVVGIVITMITVKIFIALDWRALLGQLAGIVIATGWNYFANKRWTWGRP